MFIFLACRHKPIAMKAATVLNGTARSLLQRPRGRHKLLPAAAVFLVSAALILSIQQVAARLQSQGHDDGHQDAQDWRHELRRRPRPHVHPETGTKTFSKHFVRRDPVSKAETFLNYTSIIPSWLYVDLDDADYAVKSACFVPTGLPGRVKLVIELPDHAVQLLTKALTETTLHETKEGLLHMGRQPCHSRYPDAEEEIHFYLNYTDADISSDQDTVTIDVGEASADKFLGDTIFSFSTNDTSLGLSQSESSLRDSAISKRGVSKSDIPVQFNLNYDPVSGKAKRDFLLQTPIGTFSCKDCYFATTGKFGIDFETTWTDLQGLIFSYAYFEGNIRKNIDFKFSAGAPGQAQGDSGYYETSDTGAQDSPILPKKLLVNMDDLKPWDSGSPLQLKEGVQQMTMQIEVGSLTINLVSLCLHCPCLHICDCASFFLPLLMSPSCEILLCCCLHTHTHTHTQGLYMPTFMQVKATYPKSFSVEMGGYERSDGIYASAYKRTYAIGAFEDSKPILCQHPKCAGTWTSIWHSFNREDHFIELPVNMLRSTVSDPNFSEVEFTKAIASVAGVPFDRISFPMYEQRKYERVLS